jgi:hypothetical protein
LHAEHAYDIANLLFSLVRDGGKPFALDLLDQANTIALSVWQSLVPNEQESDPDDWISRAINRPAGVIVEFWMSGLSLSLERKTGAERAMPENYRQWFTMVVHDATSSGGMGRSLLASQTAFLFSLDEEWTRQHIIPLYSDPDHQKFVQAWDGYLAWGRLYPALVETLIPAFLSAVQGRIADLNGRRRRFIEFYTALAVLHVPDPTQELLPALFQHGSLDDRLTFASRLGYFLRQMQAENKQLLWNGWLRRYWQDRIQGVLAPLDEAEIRKMLEWLPYLGDAFPSAVSLVTRLPTIRIEHSHLLFELRESELVTRYPAETAELVIYLANCVVGYQVADLGNVAGRLYAIPAELRRRLDEALAQAGVP